ncbi:MAG: MdtA/MuxA family multidrug efflux RND transporter periplasmic adaptor subunit [Methyloversatilis sp.]|uniref:MdtA/MuxA family multidrug efflux RND transporter periplasmic adaptor subunit n=1 Tax=Methyloversatilis sp. TaxID=2569862 RepID=UPI0027376042|nr:MdtA/MuxA family multidrug efflux RND transporter periplasmic adaptor subunit [Methyloversatilis sp.]MDP3873542.1 MdtA/MuxA family multidrug efflux RND transporter periplasmic adaptor subunit [Methyloversatilis sp.]
MTTTLPVIRKPRWPWILMLLVLAGLTAGWFLARERTGAPAEGGGPPGARPAGAAPGAPGAAGRRFGGESRVGTALATRADLPVTVSALGTVTPIESVVVRSRVEGELRSLHFTEGQRVKKGDLLALIDPRAFEVELAQTQAAKLRNQALLTNAREDLNRYETLLKQDSIATQQVTNQQALVREYEAAIKADEASIAAAQLSLSYARITAPISGRVGLRQATPGNIVRASDTEGLLTITQEAPISVVFSLPAPELPAVRAAIAQRGGLAVEAWDRENRSVLTTGTLRILDNQIDVATGTVKAKAMFENRDDVLFPNQFVNVRVRVDTVSAAVVVPVTAIQRSASGTFVYVVGDDLTVAMRPVKTGTLAGELQQVTEGVQPGERVVTDGVDRLREGDKVKIDDVPAAGARAGKPDAASPGRRDAAPAR